MTKKLSWELQGRALKLTVEDGRTKQEWTIRPTHTAEDKALTLHEVAEVLDPTISLVPVSPIHVQPVVATAGPIPAPIVPPGANIPGIPIQDAVGPSVALPEPLTEAQSLENLKAYAARMAQGQLGLVREGHRTNVNVDDLPEVMPTGAGGVPGLPQLASVGTGSPGHPVTPRERPDVFGSPNYRWEDTH